MVCVSFLFNTVMVVVIITLTRTRMCNNWNSGMNHLLIDLTMRCGGACRGSIYAMYNMYQDTSSVAAWEECFSKTMGMLGMKRALTAEVEGRCAHAHD
jgi:hypothetical protein